MLRHHVEPFHMRQRYVRPVDEWSVFTSAPSIPVPASLRRIDGASSSLSACFCCYCRPAGVLGTWSAISRGRERALSIPVAFSTTGWGWLWCLPIQRLRRRVCLQVRSQLVGPLAHVTLLLAVHPGKACVHHLVACAEYRGVCTCSSEACVAARRLTLVNVSSISPYPAKVSCTA